MWVGRGGEQGGVRGRTVMGYDHGYHAELGTRRSRTRCYKGLGKTVKDLLPTREVPLEAVRDKSVSLRVLCSHRFLITLLELDGILA